MIGRFVCTANLNSGIDTPPNPRNNLPLNYAAVNAGIGFESAGLADRVKTIVATTCSATLHPRPGFAPASPHILSWNHQPTHGRL
jgi:hypothetical protein